MHKRLALLLALLLVGCAGFASALTFINTALSDAQEALALIDTAYNAYQETHTVSPADRAEFDKLYSNAMQDLNTGTRLVADAKQIDQGQFDAAFKDFKTDYVALTDYLKAHGITPIGSALPGASPSEAPAFPVPRILTLKIAS